MDLVVESSYLFPFVAAVAAVLLDRWLGEPRRGHPLVGFGRVALALEACVTRRSRLSGLLAWGLLVGPVVGIAFLLHGVAPFPVDVVLLYFALGMRSLEDHAESVRAPLQAGDLDQARQQVGRIVSRETATLSETGVAGAAVESVLENGNDAVFGTLFWFLILGGPGALLFRLANTLDAMWGYKTARFLQFGWAAARLDDLLNWPAARLTALTYAALGRTRTALSCWRRQAPLWDSPNAGPVMAAGAGSLGVVLGGPATYHGQEENRPPLGEGQPPTAADIHRAVVLVRRGMMVWLAVFALVSLLMGVVHV